MLPELVGRLPVVAALNPLTEVDLVAMDHTEERNSEAV